jgi:hypothetical protein
MATPFEPFRFLDLPAELRLMVYEFIPFSTCHITMCNEEISPPPTATTTLVIKSLSVGIPGTCKLLDTEAFPIHRPKLEALRAEPVHFVIEDSACVDKASRRWKTSESISKLEKVFDRPEFLLL